MSDPATKLAKCRHFTGIQHDRCALGVEYDSVRAPREELGAETTLVPCLRRDGPRWCPKFDAITLGELQAEEKRLMAETSDYVAALVGIREAKRARGSITCPRCLGVLRFVLAGPKKHIHARCETAGCLALME